MEGATGERMRRSGVAAVLGLALLAGGCSAKAAKRKPAAAAAKIGAVDPDSAITADAGRISVRSPVAWTRGPRSDDYVVRYTPGPQKTFPAIVVEAADPPGGINEVTAATHDDFVSAVAGQLSETFSKDGKSTLLTKPAPVTLGPHRGVSWAAPGTAKVGGLKQPIERACVAVVVAGRMYTVEARAPKGKLDDDARAAARGVAAGIGEPVSPADAKPFGGAEPTPDAAAEAEQP